MNRLFDLFSRKKENEKIRNSIMKDAIKEWSNLYETKQKPFNNGINIASCIASELARLTTIEFESEIHGSNRADFINTQYQRVIDKARIFTEYACAKGGVVLKPYIDKGKILVSIIQQDAFCPTAFSSSGDIISAVFYETFFENGFYYTRLEEHEMGNNCVIIKNTAYKSRSDEDVGKEIPISEVKRWANILPICKINNVSRPLFCYFKMPMANTIDYSSPLGVSAFSRATELIKDAQNQYNNLLWEFESGKRALYVDECAIRRDDYNNALIDDKRLYRMLSADESLFNEWSPQLRDENILNGLDRILKFIEFNCGLAYGTLSDIQHFDKTAEEIRFSKQRSYATVKDIQKSLKKSLEELIEIMKIYCDIYDLCPRGKCFVSFNFDDSIVCDRTKEFEEKISLLDKNIIDKWELRSWYLGENEETAKKRIGDINESQICNRMA